MTGILLEQSKSTTAPGVGAVRPQQVVNSIGALLLIGQVAWLGHLWWITPASEPLPLSYLAGWVGLASMVVMQLYSVRRRFRFARKWGALRTWLGGHLFLGLEAGICVGYHSLRIDHWMSAQGVALLLVLIVIASGLLGRYLLMLISKTVGDILESAANIDAELAEVVMLGETMQQREVWDREAPLNELSQRNQRAKRETRQALDLLNPHDPRLTHVRGLLKKRQELLSKHPRYIGAERALRSWLSFHRPLVFLLATAIALHVMAHFTFGAFSK